MIVLADQLAEECLHVVCTVVAHCALLGAVGIVAGHRRRPDAEDALVRATATTPDLCLRDLHAARIGIQIAVGVNGVVIRERRSVHLLQTQQVVVDQTGRTLQNAHDALLVFAAHAGMDWVVPQQFLAFCRDRASDDDAGARNAAIEGFDEDLIVVPAWRCGLDHDVIEVSSHNVSKVFFIRFTQGDAVAERDLHASVLGGVGGGVTHEERVRQVPAERRLVRGFAVQHRERPTRAGAHATDIGLEGLPLLIVGRLPGFPPRRIAEQDFHRSSDFLC